MLGLAAAVGGCLSFAPAESEAAHTGCGGAGAAATPLMRASRSAVGVIQRIYLQRGLAPGRSSRRALSAVALAATRQNR